MVVILIGSACLGLVIGWVTHTSLHRRREAAALSGIAAVLAALGGAGVAAAMGREALLAWYAIGFFCGFFLRLALAATVLRQSEWLGEEPYYPRYILRGATGRVIASIGGDAFSRAPERGDSLGGLIGESEDERPTRSTPRFANAALFDSDAENRLDSDTSLKANQIIRLRLDIGPLSRESQVESPIPFPDEKLPPDIDLDVMISSTDFGVSASEKDLIDFRPAIAHGNFFLPGDGGPATVPGGGTALEFYLKAPEQEGKARCRIGYYYRDALVQSQLLTAAVGMSGGFRFKVDFTISKGLTHLQDIPLRPRVSILTNANGGGDHQIVVRAPGSEPQESDATFSINAANLGNVIRDLRRALALRAPTQSRRTRNELIEDLRELAPKGRALWSLVANNVQVPLRRLKQNSFLVLQISRTQGCGLAFPWGLIYGIPLESGVEPELCPLIESWEERTPLVSANARVCPHGPHTANVLCPFGFWGFSYAIDQLTSTPGSHVATEIATPPDWDFVMGQTLRVEGGPSVLSAHAANLKAALLPAFPGIGVEAEADRAKVRALMGRDIPVLYFYCHGDGRYDHDPNTYLSVGNSEPIKATDLQDWIDIWANEGKFVWDKVRPLVFINACHSLEIYPETLVSYLDAFIGAGNAAGVIGTEVKIDQTLAMKIAERFFALFLGERQTVETALRTVRMEFLAQGNLLGLFYTPYCWSELHMA